MTEPVFRVRAMIYFDGRRSAVGESGGQLANAEKSSAVKYKGLFRATSGGLKFIVHSS